MAAYTKFDCFVEDMAHRVHDLAADTLKCMLVDVQPNRVNAVVADLSEIVSGNGYVLGGKVAPFISDGQINGQYTLYLANPSQWVASGGTIGPFKYVVLYNASRPGGPLIAWWEYPGAAITMQPTEKFGHDLDQVNGTLQLG